MRILSVSKARGDGATTECASVTRAGTPKRLFSAEPFGPPGTYFFDVGPDEQRFLFTRPVSGGDAGAQQDRIVNVQNFLKELRGKVPK